MAISVDTRRIRPLNEKAPMGGLTLYWMSRDQRISDNWALLHAQEIALKRKQPLAVAFCLVPEFLGSTRLQYSFMLKGLKEVEKGLRSRNIDFFLLRGEPGEVLVNFCRRHRVKTLITDFSPLRINRRWKEEVATRVDAACYEVDTHNVVPCWWASPKQEYAAYTFRPKVNRLLPEFLTEIPDISRHPHEREERAPATDWLQAEKGLGVGRANSEGHRFAPGESAAKAAMEHFINSKLDRYDAERNDPVKDGQSNLSCYFHFGQLSPQRVAFAVKKKGEETGTAVAAFLEELVVRRELADNFCFYNHGYDTVAAFPGWAQESLARHAADPREYIYTLEELEAARTHDQLWNAAQTEMLVTGKMHGYLRMYWAKKILEWTSSPPEALEMAIYLNDKYSLDGRDPNGYCGIAWSIGGVHDRAWFDRPVFGKIRYMSYSGSKSKFSIEGYIKKVFKNSRPK